VSTDSAAAASVGGRLGEKPRSVTTAIASGLILAAVVGHAHRGKLAFFVLASSSCSSRSRALRGAESSRLQPGRASRVGLCAGGAHRAYRRGMPALALVCAAAAFAPLWGATVPSTRVRTMLSSTYLGVVYGPFLVGFAILLLRGARRASCSLRRWSA